MKVVYKTAVEDWVQSISVHSECLAAKEIVKDA